LQYRYADRCGLSMLALIAVVLLSLGGQRSEAASVPISPAPEQPATETVVLPAVSHVQAPAEIGKPPLSELEETRAEILALRSLLSNRGGRESASLAPAAVTPIVTVAVTVAVPVTVTVKVTMTATATVKAKPSGPVNVPILMYHHIDVAGPTADAIRRDLSVPPVSFAAQVDYLARNGYHALSLADLVDCMATGKPLPPSPVVLTFDDGYLDNYTNAFPVLKNAGFAGTFFIITDFVGQGEYMTWYQAAEMAAWGMDLESHTLDHPDLAVLPANRLLRQLTESRAILEQNLGKPVRYLSYPAGRYNGAVSRAAEQAGYVAAVTTVYGESHSWGRQFELTRIRVRGTDSLAVFAQKVRGPDPTPARAVSNSHLSEAK
jgi:peptidoglycan/xylan/chitin deacetylase (PgdA/CDA1 family)